MKRKQLLFRTAAVLVAITGVMVVFVCADIIVFWYDNYRSDIVLRVRDANERGPGLYEQLPQGLRLRRCLQQDHYDVISNRNVLVETNELGNRSPPIGPKDAGEFRILVLGDSITLGAYCEYDETYPHFIEKALGYRTINAGVAGISLNCSFKILQETGLLTQPDIVIVGMYLNDVSPSHLYTPLNNFLGRSALLEKLYKTQRYKQMEEETASRYRELTGNDLPEPYPGGAWKTDPAAFEYEKSISDWGVAWQPQTWEQLRKDMEQFVEVRDRYGFALVFVLFPCTLQVQADFLDDTPQRFWERITQELGIPHLDLLPLLRSRFQQDGISLAYDHCHLTPAGNKFVGSTIAEFLKREVLPGIQSAPPPRPDPVRLPAMPHTH